MPGLVRQLSVFGASRAKRISCQDWSVSVVYVAVEQSEFYAGTGPSVYVVKSFFSRAERILCQDWSASACRLLVSRSNFMSGLAHQCMLLVDQSEFMPGLVCHFMLQVQQNEFNARTGPSSYVAST